MARPRTRANQNPQEPDLANMVATLQRQLMEQQQETDRLQEQIARLNQILQANVVPPQENPVLPVVPQVPEVHPEIPRNTEVPITPVGVQANPPLIREDLLYERFRKILATQQYEFNNFKQGSMTVLEAVKKFEQLARLCLELIPNETEKVRIMIKMFRTDIAKQVSAGSSPPTLVSDCISQAIRAQYWINKDKEARAQIFKAKKEEKAVVKQSQPRQNQELYLRGQSGNAGQNPRHFGKNKRKENATSQGQQRNYPQKKINREFEPPVFKQEFRQSVACGPSKDRRPDHSAGKTRSSGATSQDICLHKRGRGS
ncbi:hypothetical protein TIFTF001_045815 [Ficus carica]|uniref:Gag protein n=1 Tax=Ficus carica TaxID=3494 RepID=A0AA88CNW0_FICCA|nr:hypothetical protein TIFTF001_045815 [Ficus carica]